MLLPFRNPRSVAQTRRNWDWLWNRMPPRVGTKTERPEATKDNQGLLYYATDEGAGALQICINEVWTNV